MVGSIIDIEAKKQAESKLQKSIEELTQLNKIMVDRELRMVALKKEISAIKGSK
jgi:butyrate kinase